MIFTVSIESTWDLLIRSSGKISRSSPSEIIVPIFLKHKKDNFWVFVKVFVKYVWRSPFLVKLQVYILQFHYKMNSVTRILHLLAYIVYLEVYSYFKEDFEWLLQNFLALLEAYKCRPWCRHNYLWKQTPCFIKWSFYCENSIQNYFAPIIMRAPIITAPIITSELIPSIGILVLKKTLPEV